MRILFHHNNFPGQYRRILKYLGTRRGYKMSCLTLSSNQQEITIPRVNFKPHRQANPGGMHPSLLYTENAVLHGHAAFAALHEMKKRKFKPDIILTHSGWGASLFFKDVFPDAKQLSYFEWYYNASNSDVSFVAPEKAHDPNQQMRIRMKNTPILHDLAAMDWGQCPTHYQLSRFPAQFRDRISVLHDGVDTGFFSPDETAAVEVEGKRFSADDEIITYVARGMEPYRGFHQFMEAVSILQKQRPNLQVIILGADKVSYSAACPVEGKTYKDLALEAFEFDHARLHFLGLQPLDVFRDLMRITRAHVYLTVPFVLSWSMMEAMATGALVVGSRTAPVEEVIEDGRNGLLVPFFEPATLAETVCRVLAEPAAHAPLRKAARETILERYDIRDLLPRYEELIVSVANGSHSGV